MEKFYQHIERLLSQHDYVVVPNLGGFIVQMKSAKILSDRITPPHATIGFNTLMNNSDGLLAIEISRSEQISYRKAVEYIDSKVEYINLQLNTSGNIVIGDLGILQKNNQGSIIFNPVYKSGFLPQNIGLTDLYIVPKEIQRIHEKRKLTISIPSNGIMKYAVAAVIVLGLLIVSPHVSDIPKSNYASLASLSSVNSFENNEEQSIEKKVVLEKPVEVKKAGTDITKTKELAKVINNDVEADNYHVIVASLPTRASAQKLCDELIKDKFTEARVLPSSKMYRVAIQSFKSKGTADEFIQNLRKSDVKFETAWIFSK